MHSEAVILYGPPASGKDTVTAALLQLAGGRYSQFEKLKIGDGNLSGYRSTSEQELAKLQRAGSVQQVSVRYGNKYVIDRPHLTELLAADKIPVVHMGQLTGIRELLAYPARWTCVLLWCARDEARERLRNRQSPNLVDRLAAWDATHTEIIDSEVSNFSIAIRTDLVSVDAAAQQVDAVTKDSDHHLLSRAEIIRIINEAPTDSARANLA